MEENKSILLIDNDVMVSLFDIVYQANKIGFRQTISYLATLFHLIWVPRTVYKEFLRKRRDRKRSKRLKAIFSRYQFIGFCPIPVGKNEIVLITGGSSENAGETDAVLQGRKAPQIEQFQYKRVVFLTNDRGAMGFARQMGVAVFQYRNLQQQMLELGVELPN